MYEGDKLMVRAQRSRSGQGDTAIPYYDEDPFLRKEHEETLKKEETASRMEASLYQKP